MTDNCPFCEPDTDLVWFENEIRTVIWDAFPVSNGHSLVIPSSILPASTNCHKRTRPHCGACSNPKRSVSLLPTG